MLHHNPAAAAAAMEARLQQRQQQLLVLLSASSSARPFAPLWPPSNASAAAAAAAAGGGPSELPAAAGGEDASGGSGAGAGGSGGGGSGSGGAGGETSTAAAGTAAAAVSAWDIALCATGTAVACENALVLAVLFYTPSLRAPAFLLVGSLALADLLAGLGLVANFGVQHLLAPPSEAAALAAAGLLLAAFSASLCSLLAITVDRYLSLCNALTYHAERKLASTAALLLLGWLACLGAALPPLLGWNCLREPGACSVLPPVTREHAAVLAVAFLLLFALMLQLYLQICRIAFRHAQQIAVQRQFIAAAQATSPRKGLCTLALILGTFAVCWIPFAIYALVADASYPPVYTYSLALPATCNSLINPIIYAFRNPDIQKSLWLACCGCVPSGVSARPRTSSDV
ncbi:G-protein coupled receptor 12-like [Hemicordylus capensis]|uniref:G-protein coupled receptor 12-like n=1 Tax=Hemicordylus capensis TaxID=884348 RepID=UPI0023045F0C|nr:G-protein coupled receptor 12-like [Hemicordylus capensis]XP_053129273.1 G-protein coupled receptor 12-like [Hemicordylus capensis]XP_053129274.1 G-protein coupled receptor 12-like [Hemicordylus capensis]